MTFACNELETFANIWLRWIPRLRKLGVKAPISIVGSKYDLVVAHPELQFPNEIIKIYTAVGINYLVEFGKPLYCLPTLSPLNIPTIFYNAQLAVLFPVAPLLDKTTQTLTPRCSWVLRQIFNSFDGDNDGVITDEELNNLEVTCFHAPLLPSDIVKLKETIPNALEQGLSFEHFLYIFQNHFISTHIEAAWAILRKFGYNDELKLACHIIQPIIHSFDQSVELSGVGITFLERIFNDFDTNHDEILQHSELVAFFSMFPESPWIGLTCEQTVGDLFQGLSLDAFLSQWTLATLLNPTLSVENLVHLGYNDPRSAINITRKRHIDRKNKHCERNVFQCFIFGAKKAGKSTLLNNLIGRPFSEAYSPTESEQYAVNVVDGYQGDRKYLVLKEIPRDGVTKLLANKDSLASCDVAIFVHDRSDKTSWDDSVMILEEVVRHGESGGFKVPCLIVSTILDMESRVVIHDDYYKVSEDLGMAYPITVCLQSDEDSQSLFSQVAIAAEFPHLSVPIRAAGNRGFDTCVSVGLFAVAAGICVYSAYSEFVALHRTASPDFDKLRSFSRKLDVLAKSVYKIYFESPFEEF